LQQRFPEARIDWLVEAAAASLVKGHPALDRVLVSRRKEWVRGLFSRETRRKSAMEMMRFVRELRKVRYDLIIDFHQLLKSGVMALLAKGTRKVGFGPGLAHMEMSHLFLNERVPAVSMEHHALLRNLMLLEAIGVPAGPAVYRIPVADVDRAGVSRLLGDGDRPLVAINPVAQWETKLWREDGFARLADRLIWEHGVRVVFTGGPDDVPMVAAIQEKMTEPSLNLAGKTSLPMLAALLERSICLVTTDTGPMHLGAAVNTPVVALFGPTAPWRTGPYGPGHQVVRTGAGCSPCFKRKCRFGDRHCMTGITADAVMAAVRRLGVLEAGSGRFG
jgi:3-deoxy-D-manno-octulosonic-acid transferase/heptosyltransferase-1